MDPRSPYTAFSADSPGMQTLAALKQEARADRRQRGKTLRGGSRVPTNRGSSTRRKVSRTCKILKEPFLLPRHWSGLGLSFPTMWIPSGSNINSIANTCKRIYIHLFERGPGDTSAPFYRKTVKKGSALEVRVSLQDRPVHKDPHSPSPRQRWQAFYSFSISLRIAKIRRCGVGRYRRETPFL